MKTNSPEHSAGKPHWLARGSMELVGFLSGLAITVDGWLGPMSYQSPEGVAKILAGTVLSVISGYAYLERVDPSAPRIGRQKS